MPLFAETEETIFGEILFDVVNNTNIRRSSPGSKTRSIAEAVSKKLGKQQRKFDTNLVQAFLNGAAGKYLDFLGDMMGLSRLGEEPAAVASSDKNVRFYVDVGNFGAINGGNPINLTSGTIVSTSDGGAGIAYIVPYNLILSSSASQTYVALESVRTGGGQNVGPKQLVFHNFLNYTDSANNTLKVINDAEVSSARDVESDTNFRFRIANQVLASELANLTAIRLAALNVPGVADLVMLPFHRGIGTYDLLIKATVPTVSGGLIAAVQEAIGGVSAYGILNTARKPKETGLSIVGNLTLRRRLSANEESNVISAVTANVTEYINSLDIGEDFIVNEAIERVMSTSDEIKNIGTAGKPFDQLYLFKESRLEDNKTRSTLLGDFTPEADERIIVEDRFAGSSPLLFKVTG